MPKIRTIDASFPNLTLKKKVAAYARVSEASDNLLHSLSAQVSYYNNLIQKNPEWIFAGVYADKAITGTTTAKRDELNRLLADCKAGKIDIVLVKSISRFARNTVDTLQMVRDLKEIGVDVRFEREHISSLSKDGEFMLTILASYAQEESRSISENVRWGIRKRFEQGQQNGFKAPYGYYWDGEIYRQIPEQAEAVQLIFERYLDGYTPFQIKDELKDKGYTSQKDYEITDSTVREILSNVSYTGIQILQKNLITETHKRIKNQQVLPQYLVEDMYEPIITKEIFDKTQKIKAERARAVKERDIKLTRYSGKMRCGICGSNMSRRTANKHKKWICNRKERKGIKQCCSNGIYEEELEKLTDEVVRDKEFRREIKTVTVFNDRLEYEHINRRNSFKMRSYDDKRHGVFSGRIFCGYCGASIHKETDRWTKDGNSVAITYWRCSTVRSKCDMPRLMEEDLIVACKETLGDELSPELMFAKDVAKITVFRDRLEFKLKDGEVKTWQRR